MRCWLSILVCWLGWSGLLWGHVGSLAWRTNNGLVETFARSSAHLNYVTGVGRSGTLTVAGREEQGARSKEQGVSWRRVNAQAAALYSDQTFALGGFDLTGETNSFTATASDGASNSARVTVSISPPGTVNFSYDASLQGGETRAFFVTATLVGVRIACEFDAATPVGNERHADETKTRQMFLLNQKYTPDSRPILERRDQFRRCSLVAALCGLQYTIACDNELGYEGLRRFFSPEYDVQLIPYVRRW
jgi:hypothetical protein